MRSAPVLVWSIKVLEKTFSEGSEEEKVFRKCRPGKKKKQQKLNSEGFLCVDSQEEIEIHYGRENNQEKITKTNKENLMLLRYHLIQCLTIQTEGKMARNIENHKSLPN